MLAAAPAVLLAPAPAVAGPKPWESGGRLNKGGGGKKAAKTKTGGGGAKGAKDKAAADQAAADQAAADKAAAAAAAAKAEEEKAAAEKAAAEEAAAEAKRKQQALVDARKARGERAARVPRRSIVARRDRDRLQVQPEQAEPGRGLEGHRRRAVRRRRVGAPEATRHSPPKPEPEREL